ncbi:MAG: permease prefix domain 1-containing protein, partial [Gemmatimonadaceae bacterium]
MSRLQGWMHSARSLLRPSKVSDETADEMAFHVERQTQKHVNEGIPADIARQMAMQEFGGPGRWKQEVSDARRGRWFDSVVQDIRYGSRSLRKHRGFSTVAIVTLAIGIGATTIAYTTVDHVLLRPLPYANAD